RLLAARLQSRSLTRFFFRRVLPRLILKNRAVVDRSERMLVMEHELFRHFETELFVPGRHVREASGFVRAVVEAFDGSGTLPEAYAARLDAIGMRAELLAKRGTFTHHYPITFRRVLPDDALISTSSGDEPYYAISFITYAEPRDDFRAMAS